MHKAPFYMSISTVHCTINILGPLYFNGVGTTSTSETVMVFSVGLRSMFGWQGLRTTTTCGTFLWAWGTGFVGKYSEALCVFNLRSDATALREEVSLRRSYYAL
jgi:hypothetical protein